MKQSRRKFLIKAALSLAFIPFLGRLGIISEALGADADLPAMKPDDTTAKALGFCLNAEKPTAQCSARKGQDKKDQFCNGCQLYTKVKGEGKDEMGKCLVLSKGLVPANGWCSSWVKKPA